AHEYGEALQIVHYQPNGSEYANHTRDDQPNDIGHVDRGAPGRCTECLGRGLMGVARVQRDLNAAELFADGLTFEAYAAELQVHGREFMAHYERLAVIVGELRGRAPRTDVRALAISEDWCVDNLFNLPILARLSEAGAVASLRIVRRSACRPL